MNINEYVKGKRFNDLSTDLYDWTKWCAENSAELERRIQAAGLENCERNGRILVEYALENNILVSMDNLFGVLTDARYNGRFVRIPPPPPAPVIAPTVVSLGYTRRRLAQMGPVEMKALLRNSAIGDYVEVQRQIDEIVKQPAEGEGYTGNSEDKLYQLGLRLERGHSDGQTSGVTAEQILEQKMKQARNEWDEAYRKIDRMSVQSPVSGKHDYAKTAAAQKAAKEQLGPRP